MRERHWGRWVCVRCPREWHDPPYLPLRFGAHVQQHQQRHRGVHTVRWWCFEHLAFEETWGLIQFSFWEVA